MIKWTGLGDIFVEDILSVPLCQRSSQPKQSARCLPSSLCLNNPSLSMLRPETDNHHLQPINLRGQRASSRVAKPHSPGCREPSSSPLHEAGLHRIEQTRLRSVGEGLRPGLGDTSGMCWIPSPRREPLALEGHPEREMEQTVPWKQLSLSSLINHFPGDQSKPFSPRRIETLLEDTRF